jgi:transcriptional regulator GlxA family with amidase domain
LTAIAEGPVFSLLRKPDYPINLIASQCGWQTDVFLKKMFKRTTGLTMRAWRIRELTAGGSAPSRCR